MIDPTHLESTINAAWENRADINAQTQGDIRESVVTALSLIDAGTARVAEPVKSDGDRTQWKVNQWLKKAVLLSFRLNENVLMNGGPGTSCWWDKVPSKFEGWDQGNFERAGFRAVPGAVARRGAYVAPDAVLMPSFINIGAYVGAGTMVDTWVTIGSCAQIGANCHISGGVGIGGVLEPLQANPVIIEDNCFVGARSEVAEGVILREGCVLSMGVFLGASTKIFNRETGAITYGEVPPYSVVVSGTMPSDKGGPSLYCAVVVKQVDEKTRSKTSINELLRA